MIDFLLRYKWVIIFYLIVIVVLYIKRKKLAVQAKIIFLYRTSLGINLIKKTADKFGEWIKLIGYIGIGAGYVGLIGISYFLIKSLYTLIFQPELPSQVALVLPGIEVPGLGVLSFWYWVIGIFVIAVVHEFGHGIVAKAHGLKIKSTGFVLLGPIIGAFVEPDEKQVSKKSDVVQYSIFAAGPFANILLAIAAFLLLSFLFLPVQGNMMETNGFTFSSYHDENFPAEQAGLKPGDVITGLNGETVTKFEDFYEGVKDLKPGDMITVRTQDASFDIVMVGNPTDPEKPFMGIEGISNKLEVKEKYATGYLSVYQKIMQWLTSFFMWLFVLSLGIGLFNLLPLPIVDGGRMLKTTITQVSKRKDRVDKRFNMIALLFLLVLVLTLLIPGIKWLLKFF
ncbi:site-2 protease family protein [Nanoarchaeota archaeon]